MRIRLSRTLRPVGALALAAGLASPAAAAEFDPDAFHRFVERAASDWNATGLAGGGHPER